MPIPQSELVTFETLPDGNLQATLQRFGRLVVALPNSPLRLEISVKRDPKKDFRCFVATSLSGDDKQNDAARKANGGVTPENNHILGVDGRLNPTDHESKTARNKSTGRKAARADADAGKQLGDETGGGDKEGGRGGDAGSEAGGKSGEAEGPGGDGKQPGSDSDESEEGGAGA